MCTSTIDTIRCTVLKLGHKPAGFNLPCTLLNNRGWVIFVWVSFVLKLVSCKEM